MCSLAPAGLSPCPSSGSTKSSCPQTTPPSSWHSPPCSLSRALSLSLPLPRALSLSRSLSFPLSLSLATVWQPSGKGERLTCFDANAHSGRRTEPETSPNFRSGGCTEPETVDNFHHGGAQSLRRPPILVSGERRKCPKPETVGEFMMGVQRA